MAEGKRPSSGRGRPAAGSSASKPRTGGAPTGRGSAGKDAGKPSRSGDRKPSGGRPERSGDRRNERSDRGAFVSRPPRDQEARTAEQARYDGPEIPEHITGKELDRSVHAQLKSLPEKLGLRVARHLAAAQELIDEDPKTAYEHTLAARGRAGRLAVVREAVGEAAYAAGEYAEALAELRAAKRMNGAADYVAIMADCERALKRPDRALTLVKAANREKLSSELNAELTIVEAGARRDRGELDAALRTLELSPLTSKTRAPWVARLRYAYADALQEAGRLADALTWFHRAEAIDSDGATDAAERAVLLEKRIES